MNDRGIIFDYVKQTYLVKEYLEHRLMNFNSDDIDIDKLFIDVIKSRHQINIIAKSKEEDKTNILTHKIPIPCVNAVISIEYAYDQDELPCSALKEYIDQLIDKVFNITEENIITIDGDIS